MQRTCPSCGMGFTARHRSATYCSPRCRQRASRQRRSPALQQLRVSLAEAVDGDELQFLDECRALLAHHMDDPATPGSALVPLSRALRDLDAEYRRKLAGRRPRRV